MQRTDVAPIPPEHHRAFSCLPTSILTPVDLLLAVLRLSVDSDGLTSCKTQLHRLIIYYYRFYINFQLWEEGH